MSQFLTAVASYLGSQGYGTVSTNLFSHLLPGAPVTCLAVLPTGGPSEGADPMRRRTFQIIHRAKKPGDAWTQCCSVYALLHKSCCIGAEAYRGRILAEHQPAIPALDQNNHPVYTVNYVFTSIE